MSIEVGFVNDRYVGTFATKKGETFNVNSFHTPNAINLNTEQDSYSNVFISYKNFKTGLDDYGYSVSKDDICITRFNSNVVTTFTDVDFQGNFTIGDAISVSSNINTDIVFKLQDGDAFHIKNKENMQLFVADTNETNFKQNVKIDNGGTLFVNNIASTDGSTIKLNNVQYTDATLDSLKANNTLSVEDTTVDYTGDADINRGCVDVIKTNNTRDYLKLRSTTASSGIKNVLNVNRFGNINIGSDEGGEESTINISKISNNILNYKGEKEGDVFQITQNADIGIGITDPDAQLHIKRNDGENITNPTFYRKNTMLHLDMDYDANNNTSNYFEEISATFDNDGTPEYWFLESNNTVYLTNPTTSNYFVGIENDGKSVDQQTIDDTYVTSNIFTNIIPDAESINFGGIDAEDEQNFIQNRIETFQQTLSIVYPEFTNSPIVLTKPLITENINVEKTGVNDLTRRIEIPYTLYIDNVDGSSGENDYTQLDIDLYEESNEGITFKFFLNLNIKSRVGDDPSMEYTYRKYNTVLMPRPNFLTMDKNQNFISSISANGTLSLGSEVPEEKNDYLLYAPGKCYIGTLNTTHFTSDDENSIMYFNDANFSNVNSIQTENMKITNMEIENLTATNTNFVEVNAETLSFSEITSEHFKYTAIDTKISNQLILENPGTSLLLNVSSSSDGIVKGLKVRNTTGPYDPCIDIDGANNRTPYLSLSLSPGSDSTYMRYMMGSDDNKFFQLYSKGKITSGVQQSIINYNTSENVLALGGNAICVNYNKLDEYKITIGVNNNFESDGVPSESENDYILREELLKNDATDADIYLYGNVQISSKTGDKLIQTNENNLFLTNNIIIETIDSLGTTSPMPLNEYIISLIVEQINKELGGSGSIKSAIDAAILS